MNEIDRRDHLQEGKGPHGDFECADVVVAVKRGNDITVFEGVSDRIEVAYMDDGAFWADNNPYHRFTNARAVTIQFPDGFTERYQHA